MGNQRLRFSDLIPSAWFHKLKGIARTGSRTTNLPSLKKHSLASSLSTTTRTSSSSSSSTAAPAAIQTPNLSHERRSNYFSRDLVVSPKSSDIHFLAEPPRKSSKQRRSNTGRNRAISKPSPKIVTSTASASCGCHAIMERTSMKHADSTSEDHQNSPLGSSSEHEDDKPSDAKFDGLDTVSDLALPPIITKGNEFEESIEKDKKKRKKKILAKLGEEKARESLSARRISVSSPGVRLRTNSPRIASRKLQGQYGPKGGQRRPSESFAVVKSSVDPQRDFRQSMVEMILENNIRASKDLEDLLACYLQLNSDDYHELIIKVFKQIWFDLAAPRMK